MEKFQVTIYNFPVSGVQFYSLANKNDEGLVTSTKTSKEKKVNGDCNEFTKMMKDLGIVGTCKVEQTDLKGCPIGHDCLADEVFKAINEVRKNPDNMIQQLTKYKDSCVQKDDGKKRILATIEECEWNGVKIVTENGVTAIKYLIDEL